MATYTKRKDVKDVQIVAHKAGRAVAESGKDQSIVNLSASSITWNLFLKSIKDE